MVAPKHAHVAEKKQRNRKKKALMKERARMQKLLEEEQLRQKRAIGVLLVYQQATHSEPPPSTLSGRVEGPIMLCADSLEPSSSSCSSISPEDQAQKVVELGCSNVAEDEDDELLVRQGSMKETPCSTFCLRTKWDEALNEEGYSWRQFPNVFTLRIPRFVIHEEGYAQYEILLECAGVEISVFRRFSEIYAMASSLYYNNQISEWHFPPRTWFSSTEDEFLEQRRQALQKALEEVLAQPQVASLQPVREFLELRRLIEKLEQELCSPPTNNSQAA